MQVRANGLSIEVDDRGPSTSSGRTGSSSGRAGSSGHAAESPGAVPLLLIMGLGMQLTAWPEPLVRLLVERGRRVVRLDNRDAGLSQGFDHLGMPSVAVAALRYTLRLRVRSAYTIADMARDSIGVLDALGIERAQVVGASMGGMIAQHMAASHPDRVAALTLLMTTSGARRLPQASRKARAVLLDRRGLDPNDIDAIVDRLERVLATIGSPAYPPPSREEFRARLRESVLRAYRPAGVARQLVAVAADGDRSALLARIAAPTHIVHGAADPLVPPAAAHDLHAKVRGSTIEVIEGMGHDLPAALWPRLAEAITR
jgi:pimeloyl-ACP methyl ester carboxylesterase